MKKQYEHEQSNVEPIVIEQSPSVIPPEVGTGSGILQTIGLTPGVAIAAITVDLMLFALDTVSLEALLPFSMLAACVLGFVTYRLQLDFGDSRNTALAKGAFIALITAIPVPITPIVAVPSGIAGAIQKITRK